MNSTDLSRFLFAGIAALAAVGSATADITDPLEEIRNCARTENRDERIACYETLGERVLAQEASVAPPEPEPTPVAAASTPAPTAAPPANAAPTGLPDDLSNPSAAKAEKKKKKEQRNAPLGVGHISSCQLSPDGRWRFYFDGGQIWRQNGDDRHSFEECDFEATISKDFFGYKMKIEGGETIRVRRVR